MKKSTAWWRQDISVLWKHKQRRLKLAKQIKLIQLMSNLFASGFNLTEIVNFLERSGTAEPTFVAAMRKGLTNGETLAEILGRLKFSQQVLTQVALSEAHGNLGETLALVERNLRQVASVRKKLVAVATYPLILLLFLILIMLGLKNYLLPQVEGRNFATTIIENLPMLVLSTFFGLALVGVILVLRFRRQSTMKLYEKLAGLPLLGNLVKTYITAYFAREWGLLISQGLEFRRVLEIMTTTSSRIFKEAGEKILHQMQMGHTFSGEVERLRFFTPELALMIEYGEMKAKLGLELALYADECWESFFQRCDRLMALIQPLVFLFVAMMIVLIYAAMLLPIYSSMNMGF